MSGKDKTRLHVTFGQDEPFIVQFYAVDSDDGVTGENLVGASGFTGKAKLTSGNGSPIPFTAVSLEDGPTGKVRWAHGVSTFPVGEYNINCTFTQGGTTRKRPSDTNNLIMIVGADL